MSRALRVNWVAMVARPMWHSTHLTLEWGECRYEMYSGGMVWQVVPQNCELLVYSHPAPATRNITTPAKTSVAYGMMRIQSGAVRSGEKKRPIALNILFSPRAYVVNHRRHEHQCNQADDDEKQVP